MVDGLAAVLGSTVVGAVITALVTYVGTVRKVRRDLRADYDRDLRAKRIAAYGDLWSMTQPLAKHARAGPVTHRECGFLAADLRRWYFEEGGMYLSAAARDQYFALQNGLAVITAQEPDGTSVLDAAEFEALRVRGSDLRTRIVLDVGTRNPPLRWR